MKHYILLAPFLLATSALAQTYLDPTYDITYSDVNCKRVDTKNIECSVIGTYSGKNNEQGAFFRADQGRLTLADGTTFIGLTVAGGGLKAARNLDMIKFAKGIPTKLTWAFEDVPTNISTLRGVSLAGLGVQNVRLGGTGVATVSTTSAPTGYTAVLSNCKADANGTLTCTAVLTPSP